MVVELHLHTILQRKTDAGMVRKMNIELPPGATLAEVLDILNVDYPMDKLLLVVNGKNAELKYRLNDWDIVHIIPAISGGCSIQ